MNRPPWPQHRPAPHGGGAVPYWLSEPGAVGSVWAVEASAPSSFGPIPNDQGFVALQAAYRPSGGLARGAELAGRLQHRRVGGYVSLARLVVNRQVFSFTWHNDYWLPLFQFDADDLSLQPAVQDVLAELLDSSPPRAF